jgi:uncharacterized iron-regulated membrane protein
MRSFISRSGFSALPARRRCRAERRASFRLCRRTRLLLSLLLIAAGVPAFGFDGTAPAPQVTQEPVLEGSGVPAAANWVVVEVTGSAVWHAEGETGWQRFTLGQVLPPGCVIETGADGEIVLVADGDQLIIAPQSRLIVPLTWPGQDRWLRHERGRILVQIDNRTTRNVRVETPLLTLGIKGTTFEVVVDPEQNSVVVHEGEVVVTTPDEPEAVDLLTGEGLRQPAVPGSSATRFILPAPQVPPGSADRPAWRLPPPAPELAVTPGTVAPVTQSEEAGARPRFDSAPGRSDRAKSRSSRSDGWFGWVDELGSSRANLAIIGVLLLFLMIAGSVLLQSVRELWRRGQRAKARQRRELIGG